MIDALNNNGVALIQQTHECSDGVIVETLFVHESGEVFSAGKLHVPSTKHDAQGYGSALTYARRYSLMAACGIAPEDDDGNAASKAQKAVKPDPRIASAKTIEELQGIFKSLPENERGAMKAAFTKRRQEIEESEHGTENA